MQTFEQYAAENKFELPKLIESAKRGGIAYWAYPSAYISGHYPDGYFMPSAADALVKLAKKPNDKAAPKNTP